MKYQFVICCQDDEYVSTRLHNWVENLGWVIRQDYRWTTVVGLGNKTLNVILEVDDPNKAMLVKLTWS